MHLKNPEEATAETKKYVPYKITSLVLTSSVFLIPVYFLIWTEIKLRREALWNLETKSFLEVPSCHCIKPWVANAVVKCVPPLKVAHSWPWDSQVADEKNKTEFCIQKRKRKKAHNLFKRTGREQKLSGKLS